MSGVPHDNWCFRCHLSRDEAEDIRKEIEADAEKAWEKWFQLEWDTCDIDDEEHRRMRHTTKAAFTAGYMAAETGQ